ncbi:FimV family protein [Marinobacter koreensis]|uniref:type IV pilus assembly protein FimV n=1 Tax=Marinobacter koreensis TaxID=335974 RepID=UPI00360F0F3E
MKVRKLAVALALAGGLGSGVAQALGLGEIELQSYLNEPLDAEIVLPQSEGVSPGDVFVNLAPESAYERVGLDRSQFLSKLRFEVVTGTDGNLVVNVSSREPLREPYLNFLLELTWPNGRLMREYAVLVDPPSTLSSPASRNRSLLLPRLPQAPAGPSLQGVVSLYAARRRRKLQWPIQAVMPRTPSVPPDLPTRCGPLLLRSARITASRCSRSCSPSRTRTPMPLWAAISTA